jgi:hypothetical protein
MTLKTGYLIFFLLLLSSASSGSSFKQQYLKDHPSENPGADLPSIIPQPVHYTLFGDIYYYVRERSQLVNYLETTGFALKDPGAAPSFMDLKVQLLSVADTVLGNEGYRLLINDKGITLSANTPAGLFYGHQTLRQLVMQLDDRSAGVLRLPHLTITDYPTFAWRGMLLDCCRHFMEKEFVLRYIDLLAFYKMNIFHWHLTEDQGWRIEIDKYPLLTDVGAWRTEADGTVYGGYYTKEEIRGGGWLCRCTPHHRGARD